MKIYIVGLPGVGKTLLGQILAEELGFPFFDLDEEIQNSEGKTISEIFKISGEEGFRQIERDQLIQLSNSSTSYVISCGGGTPAYFNNMTYMKREGIVVYVKDRLSTIAENIQNSGGVRPLFTTGNKKLEEELTNLWVKRRSFYGQSHIITDVSSLQLPHLFTKRLELFTG